MEKKAGLGQEEGWFPWDKRLSVWDWVTWGCGREASWLMVMVDTIFLGRERAFRKPGM